MIQCIETEKKFHEYVSKKYILKNGNILVKVA